MKLDSHSDDLTYSYYKLQSTGEIHIYQGEISKERGCTVVNISLCGAYDKNKHTLNIIKLFLKKEEAQKTAKILDEDLCSLCVERLELHSL